jgi:hypothetical protein
MQINSLDLTSFALDKILGLPPHPRMIAATIEDLPVPFGPIIMFKLLPG